MNKHAAELPISTVIIIILVILVLVSIGFFFFVQFAKSSGVASTATAQAQQGGSEFTNVANFTTVSGAKCVPNTGSAINGVQCTSIFIKEDCKSPCKWVG